MVMARCLVIVFIGNIIVIVRSIREHHVFMIVIGIVAKSSSCLFFIVPFLIITPRMIMKPIYLFCVLCVGSDLCMCFFICA